MKSESPEPYTVYITTSMMQNNTLPDEIMQPLGIRWFEFSTDKGFILNGKAYKLISTNRHQCYNRTGNVLPDKKHIRDVMLLKHIGDTRC
ncbi:MAG: hypothetical protein LUG18_04785 [Candidatus Azobacteroides sp.]|nr:hypothetical protein [Candidatus Azobacteroides sp.]